MRGPNGTVWVPVHEDEPSHEVRTEPPAGTTSELAGQLYQDEGLQLGSERASGPQLAAGAGVGHVATMRESA